MISPWRSAKCAGESFHPCEPNTNGPPMSSSSASAHTAPCANPSRNDAPIEQPDPDRGADRETRHRAPQLGIVAAREHEQHDLSDPDHAVRERELERESAERLGHAQRHDQQRRHRAEDRDPHPRPPRGRRRSSATRTRPTTTTALRARASPERDPPRWVVRHQGRALGDREDEDEVEEQLERHHSLALAQHRAEPGSAGAAGRRHRLRIVAGRLRLRLGRRPSRVAGYASKRWRSR